MENASKALILSGSILISIILITIGIQIFKPSSEASTAVGSELDSLAISSFNSHFEAYYGEYVSGSRAKELAYDVIRNNSDSNNNSIYLNLYDKDGTIIRTHCLTKNDITNYILKNISLSYKYRIYVSSGCITYQGGYNNGYLRCISIKVVDK